MTDHLPIRPDLENKILRTHPDGPSSELNEVNVRRYLTYLERSIDQGIQWTVFEPNGESLWARVRTAVTDFLTAEWHSGKLQGTAAEQAFFVRCDQTTMTQNDLDNGRLNIVIGVAPSKPAEFVIFNIAQWTSGHKP
jgi:phage tail sheath protein FI